MAARMPDAENGGERQRAMLVYTRKHGWVIVEPTKWPKGHTTHYVRKQTGYVIGTGDILATAELPPVPESAA